MSRMKLAKSVKDEIVLIFKADVSIFEITTRFRIYLSTVYRYSQNIQLFRELLSTSISVINRPRKITAEAFNDFKDWLFNNEDDKKLSYLDKIVVFLDKEFDIRVLKSTVYRTLTKYKITVKPPLWQPT